MFQPFFPPAAAETALRLGDKTVKPGDIAADLEAASRAIFATAVGILILLAIILANDTLTQFALALWSGTASASPR